MEHIRDFHNYALYKFTFTLHLCCVSIEPYKMILNIHIDRNGLQSSSHSCRSRSATTSWPRTRWLHYCIITANYWRSTSLRRKLRHLSTWCAPAKNQGMLYCCLFWLEKFTLNKFCFIIKRKLYIYIYIYIYCCNFNNLWLFFYVSDYFMLLIYLWLISSLCISKLFCYARCSCRFVQRSCDDWFEQVSKETVCYCQLCSTGHFYRNLQVRLLSPENDCYNRISYRLEAIPVAGPSPSKHFRDVFAWMFVRY